MNTGLANASGFYFKVVDSDDWLDPAAMFPLMVYLRSQLDAPVPCDMVVANYVYDKVDEGEQKVIGYGNVLPEGYEFGWDEVGTFLPSQYLLMHSVYYRTEMLRKMHLELPEHTFYVDNIFVYELGLRVHHALLQRGRLPLLHRPRGPVGQREGHDGPHGPAAARHTADD